MKILNFGSCNVDYVYSLNHIVMAGETETSEKMDIFPGGKGLNQSIAIARSGLPVFHAGCIGNDGDILYDALNSNGVNIDYLLHVNQKNGHAIIQVNKEGENSIIIYQGSNSKISCEHIDNVLLNFNCGDIILLQNEINNIKYIVEKAYEKGLCIILNPSPYNEVIGSIDLNMVSYIVLNEIEAQEITHGKNCKEYLAYFRNRYPKLKTMLTLGNRGCIYSDKEGELFQPAFKVNAIDTTAAGDTFTGYFIYGIANGIEISQTLKISSCASAIAVSRNGAAPSIPLLNEVLEQLKKWTEIN